MNAPFRIPTDAKPASLAQRLVLNDPTAWSSLPEAYTDEEWRKEAQAALDGDDRDFLWMLREGHEADARREREWQRETGRYSLNDYRDGNGPHPLFGAVL